jgi:hypothetical protein
MGRSTESKEVNRDAHDQSRGPWSITRRPTKPVEDDRLQKDDQVSKEDDQSQDAGLKSRKMNKRKKQD